MKSDYILFGSVFMLAIGLGLIFGFTHGTIGFSGAYPVSGALLQVDVTTKGLPAMIGVPLTLLGVLLLITTVISAIVRLVLAPGTK